MISFLFILLIMFSTVMYVKSKDMKWHDVKHISWLFKEGTKDLFKLDLNGVKESYQLIKIHLTHDSKVK